MAVVRRTKETAATEEQSGRIGTLRRAVMESGVVHVIPLMTAEAAEAAEAAGIPAKAARCLMTTESVLRGAECEAIALFLAVTPRAHMGQPRGTT